jgi:hypothetical protein
MSPKHLAAIALQTGRAKNHIRLLQFLEHGAVDRKKLQPQRNAAFIQEKRNRKLWQSVGTNSQ